jgi:hypothetical protein
MVASKKRRHAWFHHEGIFAKRAFGFQSGQCGADDPL